MRRIMLVLGALLGMFIAVGLAPATAHGQWIYPYAYPYAYPVRAPLDPGYGFFGSGYYGADYYSWNDPLIYDWRLWRQYHGLSGLNFGGGFGAPAFVGRPVIYANGAAGLGQPVQIGIDFLPLEYATPDLNTGAPALTGPVVVPATAPASELDSLLATLSPSDREVLARHMRKTSGKETAADIAESAARVRRTSVAAKMRASKSIDVGDALFQEQKHHEALQRYKAATSAAPDLVDSWLRQGFALAATGRYELAARAFKKGAAIDETALDAALTLDDLYLDAVEAKASHYDALARAALAEPERGDLLYVLGMMLHFDGQRERAAEFFSAARELETAPAAASAPASVPAERDLPTDVGVDT